MPEDYADYLLAEANSGSAALHQFKLLYSEGDAAVRLFFEGEEDSLFYMPEVRRSAHGRRAHIYVCGGKKNVASVRSDISSGEYQLNSCLFFADRDFDDYLGTQIALDEFTYLTDNYSIESDLVSPLSAEVIIEEFLRISRADPEFQRILDDQRQAEEEFAIVIRPFMAWCVAAKAAGSKPNFNNIDLKRILIVGPGEVVKRTKAFQIFVKSAVGSGPSAPNSAILCWRRQFNLDARKRWIRGKFLLWFFQTSILVAVASSSARRVAAGGKGWKVPQALRDARLFELLGGRVPAPASLTDFLKARLSDDV